MTGSCRTAIARLIRVAALAMAIATPGVAIAHDYGYLGDNRSSSSSSGFRIKGGLGFSYYQDNIWDRSLLFGNVRVVMTPVGISSFPVGFTGGLRFYGDRYNNRFNYDFAALFQLNAMTQVLLGMPRPAADSYGRSIIFGGNRAFADLYAVWLYQSELQRVIDNLQTIVPGVAVRHRFANAVVGASVHYLQDRDSIGYSLGVSTRVGSGNLTLRAEGETGNSFYDWNAIEAGYASSGHDRNDDHANRADNRLSYALRFRTVQFSGFRTNNVYLGSTYKFGDFGVTGEYLWRQSSFSTSNTYGASLSWHPQPGFDVRVGVADVDGSAIALLSLKHRF